MESSPEKPPLLPRAVEEKSSFNQGGNFLPKLTTKSYRGPKSLAIDRKNRSKAPFAKDALVKQAGDTKKVHFARPLELWKEYDTDTGILLAGKDCVKHGHCRTLNCLHKNSPRVQQSLTSKSKAPRQKRQRTRVQSISEAVQSIQRQRRKGLKNSHKLTLDKYGHISAKEEREVLDAEVKCSPRLDEEQLRTRTTTADAEFILDAHEKSNLNSEEGMQELWNNCTSHDDCASLYRRLDRIRREKAAPPFPQSAEFKACMQYTLPPISDDRKIFDERLLPAVDEEHANTDDYKRRSKSGLNPFVSFNTPHIVQLFE